MKQTSAPLVTPSAKVEGPRRRSRQVRRVGAGAAVLALTVSGCGGVKTGSDTGSSAASTIVIGADLPLSGPLAGFGSFQKWGYEHAVKEVNDAGGIEISGKKLKVDLKILDDKSDANQVTTNTQTLLSSDKAVALLGSCTPALVIPGALVAEQSKIPFVTGCAPTGAWSAAKKWAYSWDLFFSENDLGGNSFKLLTDSKVSTNKKVAILHDNGPDGAVVGGTVWPQAAAASGYKVVANEQFPTDTTDFSAAVEKAKNSGADILLVDAVTPQAVSIRKQLQTAGYTPKVLVMEKGAEPVAFAQALGSLANGVIVGGYWDPSLPNPGAKELATAYTAETGQGYSQHIADSYTAAKILLEGITKAGSTDATAVNTKVGETDGTYPVGKVKFTDNHAAVLPTVSLQWTGGKTQVVWPISEKTGTMIFPIP